MARFDPGIHDGEPIAGTMDPETVRRGARPRRGVGRSDVESDESRVGAQAIGDDDALMPCIRGKSLAGTQFGRPSSGLVTPPTGGVVAADEIDPGVEFDPYLVGTIATDENASALGAIGGDAQPFLDGLDCLRRRQTAVGIRALALGDEDGVSATLTAERPGVEPRLASVGRIAITIEPTARTGVFTETGIRTSALGVGTARTRRRRASRSRVGGVAGDVSGHVARIVVGGGGISHVARRGIRGEAGIPNVARRSVGVDIGSVSSPVTAITASPRRAVGGDVARHVVCIDSNVSRRGGLSVVGIGCRRGVLRWLDVGRDDVSYALSIGADVASIAGIRRAAQWGPGGRLERTSERNRAQRQTRQRDGAHRRRRRAPRGRRVSRDELHHDTDTDVEATIVV
jgi:hypothetical protein